MRRGFTLIETMTVLAIGGVLTSLAVIGLRETIAATSETRAARSVAQVIKRARTAALVHHARTGIRLNATLHRLEIASCPQRYGEPRCIDGSTFVIDGPALPLRTDFVGVRVNVSDVDADDNIVTFNADGRATLGAGFVFDHPLTPGAQEVVVSVAGDVRIQPTSTQVLVDES